MSISSEIESIRAELTRLQTKLIILESRLKPDSSALATKITSVSTINKVPQSRHCKTIGRSDKALCSVKAGDSKTLRSRSFRVMQHLIAMVDVSHAEASPDRSNSPSDRGRHRDLPNLPQSTTGKKLKPKQNNNPKVPPRQSKTFSARDTVQTTKPINNSTSDVTVQPFSLIPQMATLHDVIKAEYQGLCFPSDQSLKTNDRGGFLCLDFANEVALVGWEEEVGGFKGVGHHLESCGDEEMRWRTDGAKGTLTVIDNTEDDGAWSSEEVLIVMDDGKCSVEVHVATFYTHDATPRHKSAPSLQLL
ncbi:hypothetical protein PSTG_03959 [Puccinia striiformis f. sp. tritici PST-78]|uniref:Uncharacterized protein n=1 Tax=Puccinia striiformis f. sp. tritici PST-78 TaxID=1165861 RepID=A0A0L0VTR9_9BASI|nr:hypothetical protein PSTG_03959 [Puccinia striiformis f. sp. tritici PST-78]